MTPLEVAFFEARVRLTNFRVRRAWSRRARHHTRHLRIARLVDTVRALEARP